MIIDLRLRVGSVAAWNRAPHVFVDRRRYDDIILDRIRPLRRLRMDDCHKAHA